MGFTTSQWKTGEQVAIAVIRALLGPSRGGYSGEGHLRLSKGHFPNAVIFIPGDAPVLSHSVPEPSSPEGQTSSL